MSKITLRNINKSFDGKTVFENYSIAFEKGKRYCIMGQSGIGKTTLFNFLLNLKKPDSGEIDGVPDSVSAVFQEDRLFEAFSSVENIRAVAGKSIANEEITKLLFELGLSGSEDLIVSRLSGGMKRRVAIARALLAESQLLIMDEPFKGLDGETRTKTAKVILEYAKNKTIIFSTHDIKEAELLQAEIVQL